MDFVGSAVLLFFLAVYGTLAVVLMARVIAAIVNDFRSGDPEAERYMEPNRNEAPRRVYAAE
jgi:hypothetical protein